MKKIYAFTLILSLLTFSSVAQAQEYSSNLPVPPTAVAPVTPVPTPTPTPRPTASPVATVAPMPVSGSIDATFVFLIIGLVLTTIGFYKVKFKD